MAGQNLYIPSETGSYKSAAGEIRLHLYYQGGGGHSETFDAPYEFASELKYNYRKSPDSDKVELSNVRIKFWNRENIFEDHCGKYLFDDLTDRNQLFLDIYRNGTLYWSGVADFINIRKESYFYNGVDIQYRFIIIPFLDKIAALDYYTVDEAGLSEGDSLSSIFAKIANVVDLALNYTYATKLRWTEPDGTGYDMMGAMPYNPLNYYSIDLSMSCLEFLRRMGVGLGLRFFSYNGQIWIMHHNDGTFSGLAPYSNDLPIGKVEKQFPATYAAVKGTQDYQTYSTWENKFGLPRYDTRRFEGGARNANERQNLVVDASEFLEHVGIDVPSGGGDYTTISNFSFGTPADHPGCLSITITAPYQHFADRSVESGMVMYWRGLKGEEFYSVILDFSDDYRTAYLLAAGKTAANADTTKDVLVFRRNTGLGGYSKIWKQYRCLEELAAIIGQGFLGEKTIWAQSTTFRPPYQGFSFEGDNYNLAEISYNFRKGVCTFEGDALGPAPTLTETDDIAPNETSVASVDDGVHKVPASQIYNHIHDGNIHIQYSAQGTSYLRMIDSTGVIRYVYLTKVQGRLMLVMDAVQPPL